MGVELSYHQVYERQLLKLPVFNEVELSEEFMAHILVFMRAQPFGLLLIFVYTHRLLYAQVHSTPQQRW